MGKKESSLHSQDEKLNKSRSKPDTINQLLLKSANPSKSRLLHEGLESIGSDLLARISSSALTTKNSTNATSDSDSSDSSKSLQTVLNTVKIKKENQTPVQSCREDSSSSSDDELTMPTPIQVKKEPPPKKSAVQINPPLERNNTESDSEPEMPNPIQIKKEPKSSANSSSGTESEPEIPLPIRIKKEPKEIKKERKSTFKNVNSKVPAPVIVKKQSETSLSNEETESMLDPKLNEISSFLADHSKSSKVNKNNLSNKKKLNVTVTVPAAIKKDFLSSQDSSCGEEIKSTKVDHKRLLLKPEKNSKKMSVKVPIPIKNNLASSDSDDSDTTNINSTQIFSKPTRRIIISASHNKVDSLEENLPKEQNEIKRRKKISGNDKKNSDVSKEDIGRQDIDTDSGILKNRKKRKLSASQTSENPNTINSEINSPDKATKKSRKNSESDRTSQDSGLFSDEQHKVNVIQQVVLTPRKAKSWQEQVQQQFPHVRQIELNSDFIDSDINMANCDIHLLRIPRSVDPQLLMKLKLHLDEETKFTLCGTNDEYAIKPTESLSTTNLVITDKPLLLNFKSVLKMNKYVKSKKIREICVPEKCSVSLPDNLKIRHPLFGAEYEPKIKLEKDVELRLQEAERESASKPKRKKKKKVSKASDVELQANEIIFDLLNAHSASKKKKKKKTEESSYNGLDVSCIKREVETEDETVCKKKRKTKQNLINESLDLIKTQLYPELNQTHASKMKSNKDNVNKKKKSQVVNSTFMINSSNFPSFSADVSSIMSSGEIKKVKKSKNSPTDNLRASILEDISSELIVSKKKKSSW